MTHVNTNDSIFKYLLEINVCRAARFVRRKKECTSTFELVRVKMNHIFSSFFKMKTIFNFHYIKIREKNLDSILKMMYPTFAFIGLCQYGK